MTKRIKIGLAVALTVCSAFIFIACDSGKVILTTGFGTNEVFRIGSERASSTELTLYLTNIANQYEAVYGEDLWTIPVDEDTNLLENCKEMAVAQLAQVKAMKLLAKEHKVTLTEEEQSTVNGAAQAYMDSLSETEKTVLGIEDGKLVTQIYEEKLLADKLYAYLIRDVNPEISDDEARIITVQHILLKTYSVDEHGNRQDMDEETARKVYEKAEEIRKLAVDGENFDTLISKYSEDSKGTYSFGIGDMEEAFEEAAYALATEEISKVVRTSHGYHILKCISTLDREQTNLNKEKLLVSRKQEVFGSTYNQFVAELEKRENTELIYSISIPSHAEVDTEELFSIYEDKLGGLYETSEE